MSSSMGISNWLPDYVDHDSGYLLQSLPNGGVMIEQRQFPYGDADYVGTYGPYADKDDAVGWLYAHRDVVEKIYIPFC